MLIKMMDKDSKGFTLIELMIVIAIIGILAAIAIPQFSAYRKRGYNSAAQSDLKNAITAQEAYFVDNQTYVSGKAYSGVAAKDNPLGDYGLTASDGVTITYTGDSDDYAMSAWHGSGDRTYTIAGPGGTIGSVK